MTDFLLFPYIRWHIFVVLIPSIILWILYGKYFWKHKSIFLIITILSFIWGYKFDQTASVQKHLWFFDHNLGIYFYSLPLEEYLFLIFVPQEVVAIHLIIWRKLYG